MENTQTLYDLIIDVWRLVRENPNPVTEAEWEKLLEGGNAIDNNPKYKTVEPLARYWVLGYIDWVEGKL